MHNASEDQKQPSHDSAKHRAKQNAPLEADQHSNMQNSAQVAGRQNNADDFDHGSKNKSASTEKYQGGGGFQQKSRSKLAIDSNAQREISSAGSQQTPALQNQASTASSSAQDSRVKSAAAGQNGVQHQYSAHYTGGEASSSKRPQEMSALDRLKCIQNNFRQQWHGINCEISGRPGTSNFCNRKRTINVMETAEQENERQKMLHKIFSKVKELDEERQGNSNTNTSQASATNRSSMSGQPGFFSQASSTTASGFYNQNNKNQSDFIHFKNISEKQMITGNLPYNGYQKSYHIENSELLYKMIRFDNKLCRSVLEQHGMSSTDSHEWNLLWSSSSCKSYQYEGLNEYQKINHFPQSYEITRKDRLCFNIVRMQERYGKSTFDFSPDTYILPDEFGDFYNHYQKLKQHESKKNVWIVKPANACQGRGIYLVDDINDVNVDETSVICKYITNPLLINGHKFDLRIYVLVTSYEPMKIYVFQEGLARFASETYTQKINKNNKYMHLTNYSINKKNEKFIQNENSEQDDFGYKWSLGAFCKHLEQVGIDMNLLWSRIYDVILKTLLCGENYVQAAMKKNGTHRTNCFELFGFDILIDSDLKPWLIEVNLSPSLATESPLDMSIKSNLICDTFNLIGIKRFDRKKESINKIKHRMKGLYGKGKKSGLGQGIQGTSLQPAHGSGNPNDPYHNTASGQLQQMIEKLAMENPNEYANLVEPMKKATTIRYKEYVREAIAEYQRRGNYIRIYPAKNSDIYDQYFQSPRVYNKVLYKVLFTDEVLRNSIVNPNRPEIKLKMDMPMSAYEQYKKQQQDKAAQKKEEEQKNLKRAQQSNSSSQQRPMTGSSAQNQNNAGPKSAGQSDNSAATAIANPSHSTAKDSATGKSTTQSQPNQSVGQGSSQTAVSSSQQSQQQQERVLITGDDILIEYVDRLMNEIKNVDDSALKPTWKIQIEKFITHYVWHSQDPVTNDKIKHGQRYQTPFWVRLQGRLNEMQERRRRLIKYLYKKEGKLNEFEAGFQQSIQKKSTIIKKFSSIQLEDLLRTSTKNVAQEVVSSLIPPQGGMGVLADVQHGELPQRKVANDGQMMANQGNNLGSSAQSLQRRNQNLTGSQTRTMTAGPTNNPLGAMNSHDGSDGHNDMTGQTPTIRQTKTATGSRTQKSNTSYSLTAHRGAENQDEPGLPHMGGTRQQNLMQAQNQAQMPNTSNAANAGGANKFLQGSRSQSKSHKSSTFYY